MTVLQETVSIRRMTPADLGDVLKIERLSFPTPWSRKSFAFEIRNPLGFCWVAVNYGSGEKVIGSLVAWLIMDEIHIGSLAVHPDFRQQRIGSRLLINGFRELIANNARTATLEVRASNHAAQALYRRFGFRVVGVRPSYYKDNDEDAILMSVEGIGEDYLNWLEIHAMREVFRTQTNQEKRLNKQSIVRRKR